MTAELHFEGWTCPLPLRDQPNILLGHGGGYVNPLSAKQITGHFHAEVVLGASGVPHLGELADGGRGLRRSRFLIRRRGGFGRCLWSSLLRPHQLRNGQSGREYHQKKFRVRTCESQSVLLTRGLRLLARDCWVIPVIFPENMRASFYPALGSQAIENRVGG